MKKPQVQELNIKVLDILKALKYIEDNGHPGFKHQVWDEWCDGGVIPGNDCIVEYHFDEENEDDNLIQGTFELGSSVFFKVGW